MAVVLGADDDRQAVDADLQLDRADAIRGTVLDFAVLDAAGGVADVRLAVAELLEAGSGARAVDDVRSSWGS